MKKLILKNLLAILLLFATGISFSGCATPPTRVAVEVAGTQNALVVGAMKAWADYSNAGNTTQAQIDQVKNLYSKYQKVAAIEKDALIEMQKQEGSATDNGAASRFKEASTIAAASEKDLLDFIHQFVK